MSGRIDAVPMLARLKDFQRRTVDYVFQRMFLDSPPAQRFLVADEVGLGKTLVAKGIIGRTIEHLQDHVERIDIVYVCSNAAIAQQNINRLTVVDREHTALPTRLTLLPEHLGRLSMSRINFISFTPGTAFDLRSKGGIARERAILHRMLAEALPGQYRPLANILHGRMNRDRFWQVLEDVEEAELSPALTAAFIQHVTSDRELWSELNHACETFRRHRARWPDDLRAKRRELTGRLRLRLARACVNDLQPDLVILDEFQRFANLLHGEDDAAELARTLMTHRTPEGRDVRVLLLSATPYRPLSLYQDGGADDHYEDFRRTVGFLMADDAEVLRLEEELQQMRDVLFDPRGREDAASVRGRIEARLRSVMVRTERVASTVTLDGMLVTPSVTTDVKPVDLHQARLAHGVARALGAQDTVEYWKSAPYFLQFMRRYDIKDKLQNATKRPSPELISVLQDGRKTLIRGSAMSRYRPINPANGRLRALMRDVLGEGQWRMLWVPPTLPYLTPGGAYASAGHVTKSLVFSSWKVVPDAVAALVSYEAERRMLEEAKKPLHYGHLGRQRRPLLRFAIREGRESGMPALALLYPSATLADIGDPLELASSRNGIGDADAARATVAERVRSLTANLVAGAPSTGAADESWYWAAPAMLDARRGVPVFEWCTSEQGWMSIARGVDEEDRETNFERHVRRFCDAAAERLDLGRPPEDLHEVLADFALASPAVCAYRAFRRVFDTTSADAAAVRTAAARVAWGFRSLFNVPETVVLLRGDEEDEAYWRLVLQHGIEGNLQALLDEYVHVLHESLGLMDVPVAKAAETIAAEIADAASLRPAPITIDEIQSGAQQVRLKPLRVRSRFALRFAETRDDDGKKLARLANIRQAFNSPFRPFVLLTTSVGQEGLDFHTYCHRVYHWNLPGNPVDLEQREGRVHRYKGHAVRLNVAKRFANEALQRASGSGQDPWRIAFDLAASTREPGTTDLIPYWIYPIEGGARIERLVPMLPFSREHGRLRQLQRSLALYRAVFGQPRQEDLLVYLSQRMDEGEAAAQVADWRIDLTPPAAAPLESDLARPGQVDIMKEY